MLSICAPGFAVNTGAAWRRAGLTKRAPMDTHAYAQARANETGRPYLITVFGHCFMDCPKNRTLALNPAIGEGIAEKVYPNYSPEKK